MPHRTDVLNRIFKRIIGDETATQYYLRHTFATKCQEYVRPDIVDIWMYIGPEGLSDGFIRTFPTSLCKSKWTRLFSIFKRYLFPKTFPKRANLCNFLFIFYAKQAQKKQITEFLFDNLHKWCGRQELKQLNKGENGGFLRGNGQKRLVFLILPARSPWAKSIFSLPARRAFSRNLFFEFLL